jgi:hypothetical protein
LNCRSPNSLNRFRRRAVIGFEAWERAEISAPFPIAVSVQSTLEGTPVSGVKVAARQAEPVEVQAQLGGPVELAVGETAVFGDGLSVRFWNVPADSRCPTDEFIVCIWEGEAVVELQVSTALGGAQLVRLTTYGDRNAADVGDYRIELLQVTPAPVEAGPIPIDDYRIQVMVEQGS